MELPGRTEKPGPAYVQGMTVSSSDAPLMILVAGPYRSGTGDDPALIAANMKAMNDAALAIFRRGHLPVTGEALALPLIQTAGSTGIGDAPFVEIFHPLAHRLLLRCDAVLRIGGASVGADEMVSTARKLDIPVFFHPADIPDLTDHTAPPAGTHGDPR